MTLKLRKLVFSAFFWLLVFAAIVAGNTYWALTHN